MDLKNTLRLPIEHPLALKIAAQTLHDGKLIVFPTDTLYGLACDPFNTNALEMLYEAKNRPTQKAIPVLVGDVSQLDQLIESLPIGVQALTQRFWPGALTLVLPKRAGLPEALTPYPGLAVRMPAHPFALQLLRACGPLAVTSANLSGRENPGTAEQVLEQLSGRVDLVLDGGRLATAQASTIVDCTGAQPALLRSGPIPFEAILAAWRSA